MAYDSGPYTLQARQRNAGLWHQVERSHEAHASAAALLPQAVRDMSPAERKNYNYARAIACVANFGAPESCLELELSQALARECKIDVGAYKMAPEQQVILVPGRLERAGLDTTAASKGGNLVQKTIGDLVDFLRIRSRVISSGAQLLEGVTGSPLLPVQQTANVGQWVGENPGSDLGDSDMSFAQRVANARMWSGTTSYSRVLLQQSSVGINSVVMQDLARGAATAIDAAALAGSGGSQPTGILNTTNVGVVVAGDPNGGLVTSDMLVDLIWKVYSANADGRDMRWIINSTQFRKLAKLARVGVTLPVLVNDQIMNFPFSVSENAPANLSKGSSNTCSVIYFGDWARCLILQWGPLALVVDSYTAKKRGMVEVTSYLECDVILAHPESFSICKDAL